MDTLHEQAKEAYGSASNAQQQCRSACLRCSLVQCARDPSFLQSKMCATGHSGQLVTPQIAHVIRGRSQWGAGLSAGTCGWWCRSACLGKKLRVQCRSAQQIPSLTCRLLLVHHVLLDAPLAAPCTNPIVVAFRTEFVETPKNTRGKCNCARASRSLTLAIELCGAPHGLDLFSRAHCRIGCQ